MHLSANLQTNPITRYMDCWLPIWATVIYASPTFCWLIVIIPDGLLEPACLVMCSLLYNLLMSTTLAECRTFFQSSCILHCCTSAGYLWSAEMLYSNWLKVETESSDWQISSSSSSNLTMAPLSRCSGAPHNTNTIKRSIKYIKINKCHLWYRRDWSNGRKYTVQETIVLNQ